MRGVPLVILAFVLAGCVGQGPTTEKTALGSTTPTSPEEDLQAPTTAPVPEPTQELGALVVLVATSELTPVDGAFIELVGTNRSGRTDAAGQVTINDLDPGRYTVATAKPGYRAREEEGRVADIVAGETTELRLVLDPVPVVTPDQSFVEVIPLRGYISCSLDVATGISTTVGGYSNYCGRGVPVGGMSVGANPNDNSTHPWSIANPQVEGFWFEAQWQPSASALSRELAFSTQLTYACGNLTCTGSGYLESGHGTSPYRKMVVEGEAQNLTSKTGTDPAKFPVPVLTRVQGFCTSPCASFTLEQAYDVWVSVFYGRDPPTEYTVLPS